MSVRVNLLRAEERRMYSAVGRSFMIKLGEMREAIAQHYELTPSLAEQLAQAIATEQYELAAKIRDRMGRQP